MAIRWRSGLTFPFVGSLAVLALFAVACALPAGYYCGKFLEEGVDVVGLRAVLLGWLVLIPLGHPEGLGWFANALLVVGLVRHWKGQYASAARWAVAATLVGLCPLAILLAGWSPGVRWSPVPALTFKTMYGNEVLAEAELRVGYFVWMAAHASLFWIALVCRGKFQ